MLLFLLGPKELEPSRRHHFSSYTVDFIELKEVFICIKLHCFESKSNTSIIGDVKSSLEGTVSGTNSELNAVEVASSEAIYIRN